MKKWHSDSGMKNEFRQLYFLSLEEDVSQNMGLNQKLAFWTKLKCGVCCLDPFPFQACPEEKQKKKLSQGVKGFFMSRLFKNCYNWPGILRLRSSINSP